MSYEIDLICPECVTRIKCKSKNDNVTTYMACMGNADLISVTCQNPDCKLRFLIEESDYDRMLKEKQDAMK